MRHVQLESWTDHHGTLGLILTGTPKSDEIFADTHGPLIAHDLLEHQNGLHNIGCPRDELQALGGVWQVRGRHGEIGNHLYSPAEALAHDVLHVAIDAYDWTPQPIRTRPHICDDDFHDILGHARKLIRAEDFNPDFPVTAFLDEALHHLRTGYRKAERRFGTGYQALALFNSIKRVIEPHARHLDGDGQRFRLSYAHSHAVCEEVTWSH